MTRIEGAAVGGRLFTHGELSTETIPRFSDGSPMAPFTDADGVFTTAFIVGGTPLCATQLGPPLPSPLLPPPDEIEIVVIREECERSIVIPVTEDTVVDLSFPGRLIELKDPILIPPCEE